jgi:hypothetical protein
MTPIIVAAAVAAVIVIGACLVLMSRSRRDDEGEQFRRVADLTSRWSRQVSERPTSAQGPGLKPEPGSATTRPGVRTTESVDPS